MLVSCAEEEVVDYWNFPSKLNELSKILLGLPGLNGATDLGREKHLDDI